MSLSGTNVYAIGVLEEKKEGERKTKKRILGVTLRICINGEKLRFPINTRPSGLLNVVFQGKH